MPEAPPRGWRRPPARRHQHRPPCLHDHTQDNPRHCLPIGRSDIVERQLIWRYIIFVTRDIGFNRPSMLGRSLCGGRQTPRLPHFSTVQKPRPRRGFCLEAPAGSGRTGDGSACAASAPPAPSSADPPHEQRGEPARQPSRSAEASRDCPRPGSARPPLGGAAQRLEIRHRGNAIWFIRHRPGSCCSSPSPRRAIYAGRSFL